MRRWTLQAFPLDPDDKVAVAWAESWNAVVFTDPMMRWVLRRNAARFAAGGRAHDLRMGVETRPVLVSSIGWPR